MHARQLLLIRSSQPENTYGRFTEEILKAEGLNGFQTINLDAGMPALAAGDLVLLTRCFLRAAEIEVLYTAIEAGARVVCLQPSWLLASRLGWQSRQRTVYPGWMRVREGLPGAGLPIQAHVPVATHAPSPGLEYELLAEAVHTDWQDAGCPAVVRQRIGQGEAVLFFYDLPEAVARIRFGNPDLASLLTNGHWAWPHALDLFEGHVDDRVLHLPQADFHGQLLARALTDICPYPLARFWYYPRTEMRTAAVFQSDDDYSTPEQFDALLGALRRHHAVGTFYLMEHTRLPDETVAALQAEGHTFAPHVVSVGAPEELYFHFPAALARETAGFMQRYGARSATLQTHCAPWLGYQSWVPLHIAQGYRLLFGYLCGPTQRWNRYMCGSGRPMRFYDRDGTRHDCWQQPLLTYDDTSIQQRVTIDPAEVIADFASVLRAALSVHHTAIPILSHPVSFATYSSPFIEACFDLLAEAGASIFNGDQWLAFHDRRDAARIAQHPREDGAMTCIVSALVGQLPLLIPIDVTNKLPMVKVDGAPVEGTVVERLGQTFLAVQLEGKDDGAEINIEITPKP